MSSITPSRSLDQVEAEELYTQVLQCGSIRLPQLTDADLCVFSDAFRTMFDADVWERWLALPSDERDAVALQAIDFLKYRRLLRCTTEEASTYNIQPKLGYILAARQRPTFMGLCSVPEQLRVDDIRMFGIRDERRGKILVLLERGTVQGIGPLGRVRQYILATTGTTASVVADWLYESIASDVHTGNKSRIVDMYRHPEESSVQGDRILVNQTDSGCTISHNRDGTTITEKMLTNRALLAGYIATQMAR